MKLALSRKNLWDRLPRTVKTGVGSALGRLPASVLLGRRFREHQRFVSSAQWWPAERSRAYQLAQLRDICSWAYARTPFYKQRFDAAGFDPRLMQTPEDLSALPPIDRETLRLHLDEMCAVTPQSWGVDYTATGGTGGAPLAFYIGSDRSAIEYAYLTAGWGRAGFRLGTPLAVFRGRTVVENGDGLRHEFDPVLRHHAYSSFHMTDANLRRYLEHVRGIGPCFLHVYPSSIDALVRFILRSGIDPPRNVRGIIAESEMVYPDQRRRAEQVFGCRYFSCYGHTEKLIAGCECEHSADLHVWPTYGYFELIGADGLPISEPGQRGEIVGTGFINRVVPFIRYRTGDFATYLGDHCPACHRQHPIITDVCGHRVHEFLIAEDGSEISWTAVNVHDDTFDQVRQFQFVQDTPGRAELRVVPADGGGLPDLERIARRLTARLDARLKIDVVLTDAIPLTRQGKTIYVDQRVRIGAGAAPTACLSESAS